MTATPVPFPSETIDLDTYAVVITDEGGWYQHDTGQPLRLSFSIYSIGHSTDGTVTWFDTDGTPTDDLNARHPEAHGTIKWDGCINWTTDESCMVHGCHVGDIEAFTAALTAAYLRVREAIVPEWLH